MKADNSPDKSRIRRLEPVAGIGMHTVRSLEFGVQSKQQKKKADSAIPATPSALPRRAGVFN